MSSSLTTHDATARKRLLSVLLRAHAVPGRPRTTSALARFFGPEAQAADVLATANASGADVTVVGNTVVLTNAGLQKARSHPQSRELLRLR